MINLHTYIKTLIGRIYINTLQNQRIKIRVRCFLRRSYRELFNILMVFFFFLGVKGENELTLLITEKHRG